MDFVELRRTKSAKTLIKVCEARLQGVRRRAVFFNVKGNMNVGARRAMADEVRIPLSFHVYILRCTDQTYYVGCTQDLEDRIRRHFAGQIHYTSKRLPVELVFHAAFKNVYKAYEFEKYLKSGSGRAFAKRHLY